MVSTAFQFIVPRPTFVRIRFIADVDAARKASDGDRPPLHKPAPKNHSARGVAITVKITNIKMNIIAMSLDLT